MKRTNKDQVSNIVKLILLLVCFFYALYVMLVVVGAGKLSNSISKAKLEHERKVCRRIRAAYPEYECE